MRRTAAAGLALGMTAALLCGAVLAVEPDESLCDPALEQRARAISANVRCLVCQGQSIDESDASLARDLRLLVRERLAAGDSDDQVRTYLTARYGAYILQKPPLQPRTWPLWFGPLAFLALALAAGVALFRRRRIQ